jgi:hypothetical protein
LHDGEWHLRDDRAGVGRGRRMTYTIRIVGDDLDVDVIEFFRTHKEYARRFHY